MEGYPDIRTVDYWLDGNDKERFPQSRINCSHNKAVSMSPSKFARTQLTLCLSTLQDGFERR